MCWQAVVPKLSSLDGRDPKRLSFLNPHVCARLTPQNRVERTDTSEEHLGWQTTEREEHVCERGVKIGRLPFSLIPGLTRVYESTHACHHNKTNTAHTRTTRYRVRYITSDFVRKLNVSKVFGDVWIQSASRTLLPWEFRCPA